MKVHCLAVDVLKDFWVKNAFGLKMGLLGNIDLLKLGIMRYRRDVWSKVGPLRKIGVLKGFWGKKEVSGLKIGFIGKIDVLKGYEG